MGWDGMGWMVISVWRSAKSTYGANNSWNPFYSIFNSNSSPNYSFINETEIIHWKKIFIKVKNGLLQMCKIPGFSDCIFWFIVWPQNVSIGLQRSMAKAWKNREIQCVELVVAAPWFTMPPQMYERINCKSVKNQITFVFNTSANYYSFQSHKIISHQGWGFWGCWSVDPLIYFSNVVENRN